MCDLARPCNVSRRWRLMTSSTLFDDCLNSFRRLTQFRRPCCMKQVIDVIAPFVVELFRLLLTVRRSCTFLLSSKRRSSPLLWRNKHSMPLQCLWHESVTLISTCLIIIIIKNTSAYTDLFRTCRYYRSSWSSWSASLSACSWWDIWRPLTAVCGSITAVKALYTVSTKKVTLDNVR